MTDYDVLLSTAFEDYTQSYREDWQNGEFDCLDIEIWEKRGGDSEHSRVKFLLTCGGPTVYVEVDEYDRVTFFHSWGCNSIGEKFTENTYSSGHEDADFWIELAEEYRSFM